MTAKMMHIAQFLMHAPTYHSLAMWRHPRTAAAGHDWTRPGLYQHIARVCERGKFDMVFFADLSFISDTYTGSMAPVLRHAAQVPNHDPIPLLSWMGAVTSTIGLASTFSISNQHGLPENLQSAGSLASRCAPADCSRPVLFGLAPPLVPSMRRHEPGRGSGLSCWLLVRSIQLGVCGTVTPPGRPV